MENRISAIIIDPHYEEHNYDLQSPFLSSNAERGFDLTVIGSSDKILEEIYKNRGVDAIVTIGNEINFRPLNNMPFLFRKKWIHFEEFNATVIANGIISDFMGNINREQPQDFELFSIITPTYNTPKEYLERLYNSLLNQTYTEWDWWIIDDSTNDNVREFIEEKKDPRIFIIKNVTNHGNIGFNKHMVSMCCDGKYIAEVDHDDELLPECLEKVHKAFLKHNADFVFTDALELMGDTEIIYGDGFSFGQGIYKKEVVNGRERTICVCCPSINCKSIRGIYAMPNHLRCWKSDFYHKINGHNTELAVLDDMDILIRTFLNGTMVRVPKVLYIQHQSEGREGGNGENTQSKRFAEIQRTNWLLLAKYDKAIHQHILDLGYEDQVWDNEESVCHLDKDVENLISFSAIYDDLEIFGQRGTDV